LNPVISWDRSQARPAGISAESTISIVATAGLFGNRREVARLVGHPAESAERALLADLYEHFLLDTPGHVTGTLSWILWDERRRRLVAVGDRLGLSPLFFCERGGALHLATALEPLLAVADPSSPTSLELSTVGAYLCGQVPAAGRTFYHGIESVPAGTYLVATPERVMAGRYWQLYPRPLLRHRDDAGYAEALSEQLARVLPDYVAEAPTAAITLSSGLDSTSLAVHLRQTSPGLRLTAFYGAAPELPEMDESAGSLAVAERLGLPAVPVAQDRHWPLRTEPGLRPRREDPRFNCFTDFWDAVFTRMREQGERILFTGQGGDHLFGGNVFAYADLLLTGRWRRLAADLRLHQRLWDRRPSWIWRWMILGPLFRAYLPLPRRGAPPPWLGAALRPLAEAAGSRTPSDWRSLPGQRQRNDLLRDRVWLEETRSMNDRAAQHGVELRNPYLDHRLLEFATSIPAEQTFEGGVRKGIVRRAMAGRLPEEILTRHRKIEATALFERGLRERETGKVWQLLTGMRAAELGWVDEGLLRAEYQSYLDGTTRRTRFWHALTLEAWLRRWF
jgi:asparagine synthase (glutamine-hydrolysing)